MRVPTSLTLCFLISVVVSGSIVGCTPAPREQPMVAGQDTAAPPIPDDPSYPDDSLFVVTRPGKALPVYFRRLATLQFDNSVAGPTIRSFFANYQARIVGGSVFNQTYMIQFPDPGATWAEFDSVINQMNSDPSVELASPIVREGLPPGLDGRAHAEVLATRTAMDTSVPHIPDNPIHPDDSLYVVTRPGHELPIYYRRLATVTFADSASGLAIRAFFAKYQTQTVGGSPFMKSYTIQFPDPGPTWAAFEALIERMNLEPAVELASQLVRTDLPLQLEK